MNKEIKKWECTDCDIEFEGSLTGDGYIPECPECGIEYRVFEIK